MPHAYSVATGPAAAKTRSPEAVSCNRGAGPLPGSTGTSTRRQESMLSRLSRAAARAGRGGWRHGPGEAVGGTGRARRLAARGGRGGWRHGGGEAVGGTGRGRRVAVRGER